MPVPQRTRPSPTSPPSANGRAGPTTRTTPSSKIPSDILAMGVPFAEIANDPVHMLLYGTNGVGKTTLACQFEKPLALVSVEPGGNAGGAKSVKRIEGGTHFRFRESKQVEEFGYRLLRGE